MNPTARRPTMWDDIQYVREYYSALAGVLDYEAIDISMDDDDAWDALEGLPSKSIRAGDTSLPVWAL